MKVPTQSFSIQQGIALARDIEVLNLSRRSFNALKRAGINRVFDLAIKTTDDLDAIRNLGTSSLPEIRFKLRQYLEANSIAHLDFPITGKIDGLFDSTTRVETDTPPTAESQEIVGGETSDSILPTPELLELPLFKAAQYPHMTPERWGDFVAKCKMRMGISGSVPDGVSGYGPCAVPLDPTFAARLGARAFHALERAGVYDLDSASKITVRDLVAIRQIGKNATIRLFRLLKSESPSLGSLQSAESVENLRQARIAELGVLVDNASPERLRWASVQKAMSAELQAGRLHPKVQLAELTIAEWVQANIEQQGDHGLRVVCDKLESQLKYLTIDDELREIASGLGDRRLTILVARYGQHPQTLQEVAGILGLTRERIRQVEKRAKGEVTGWLARHSPWRLQTALRLAEEMGENVSLPKWEAALVERELIRKSPLRHEDGKTLELNALDFALVLLRANEDSESPIHAFRIPYNLRTVLDYPGFTMEEIKASKALSKKELRAIRRQCCNAGAVSAILLSRKIKMPMAAISKVLCVHGYTPLDEEWLTLLPQQGMPVSSRHSAFQANVVKMISICDSLSVDEIRHGLQNHVSRFDLAVPPTRVLRVLLQVYGFTVGNDDRVTITKGKSIKVTLSAGEKTTLSLIRRQGPIVTFQELSEEFSEKGLSQSLLSMILRYSVLFHRVDTGLYTLRGTGVTKEEIEVALARRPAVQQSSTLHYSPDGIITYEVNIGTYGLGGTIPAGEAARLAGEWKAVVDRDMGKIKVGDLYIYGLAKAFRKLAVKVGDRVALHFDPRIRQVQIEKMETKKHEEDRTV